ncbi:MAG TPA: hypothetical protein VE733_04265 [Streptosporangiaceae bacterium]|jgi:hypothetical protein|nr:hypothetical protein [Streptosporangiaceae bacterium]
MTTITGEARTAFCQQGFVVIPDVLSGGQIIAGRKVIAAMLEQQPHADDHVGPYFLWPRFPAAGHPLVDFYRETGIGELAAQLLCADSPSKTPISRRWRRRSRPGRIGRAARTSTD